MIVLHKRKLLAGFLTFTIGITGGVLLRLSPEIKTFGEDQLYVIVDAGHGAPDGGAVGENGTVEQEINLAIAKKLQEVLEGKGIRVRMTRSDESGLQTEEGTIREMKRSDMQKRLAIMKKTKADLFLSVHMNYFPGKSVHGLHVFYARNYPEMKALAEQIQIRMNAVTGAKMTAVAAADASLFLMKSPPLPAVLVECGFLSNAEEEKKLNDPDYQSRLAWAIADAVEKYYADSCKK